MQKSSHECNINTMRFSVYKGGRESGSVWVHFGCYVCGNMGEIGTDRKLVVTTRFTPEQAKTWIEGF